MSASRNDLGRGSTDWRPIDSAPRDGTEFLAYWTPPGGGVPARIIAKWTDDFGGSFIGLNVADGMGHRTGASLTYGFDGGTLYATHWMPLPEPPGASASGSELANSDAELGPGTN